MLVIRLSRKGKTKNPIYRIVISEKTKDTKGNYLEALGFYNPNSKEIKLEKDRIKHWLSKGAQPSPTVNNLLINNNVIEGKKARKGHRTKKEKEEKGETPKEQTKEKNSSEEKPAEEKKEEKPAEKEAEKPKDEEKKEEKNQAEK